jgi:tRNA pseudouridine55 synthase
MQLTLRIVCSKGTYIRALARDIGQRLRSGAHLIALRRTRVGDVRVEDCMTVEEFIHAIENTDWVDNTDSTDKTNLIDKINLTDNEIK